jgi:hypothetical protein
MNSANAGIALAPSRWATSQSAAGSSASARNSTRRTRSVWKSSVRPAGDAAHAVGQRAFAHQADRQRMHAHHQLLVLRGDLDEFVQAPVMSRFLSRNTSSW